jgi:uncharacterized membrane protein
MRLKSFDLLLTSAVALVTIIIAFAYWDGSAELNSLPRWFAPLGLLMALVLPGYALTTALLPSMDRPTLLLCSLGLSLSIDIVGGLVLHLTPWGMQPASWAVWLSGVIFSGCLIATFKRRVKIVSTFAVEDIMPPLTPETVLTFGLAVSIMAVAIGTAWTSAQQADMSFTQLWVLPVNKDETYSLQIGIRNEEKKAEHYDVYVESNGRRLEEWQTIKLGPGEQWTVQLALSNRPTHRIWILLYRLEEPNEAYRTVQVSPASFDVPSVSLTSVSER